RRRVLMHINEMCSVVSLPQTSPRNTSGRCLETIPEETSQEHSQEISQTCCRPCHLPYERSCPMTLIALTDCCRRLSIDSKTLRRWLAQAGLPVQAHPEDARCKGLSREHLRQLATLHHRWLPALPEAEPGLPTP